jgi:hypothetical protein
MERNLKVGIPFSPDNYVIETEKGEPLNPNCIPPHFLWLLKELV